MASKVRMVGRASVPVGIAGRDARATDPDQMRQDTGTWRDIVGHLETFEEKRRHSEKTDLLKQELGDHNVLVDQYQDDIRELEEKLQSAREKQRILVQRQIRARGKMRAKEEIRRMESTDAILKFEELEHRIERMESEADLVNSAKKPDLESKFENLMVDEDIEKELKNLKSSLTHKDEETPAP